jgi:hypothetical protein
MQKVTLYSDGMETREYEFDPEDKPIHGRQFLQWLHEQGIIPGWTTRVVIEASATSIVKVYVESVGTEGLVRVVAPPELKGAEVVVVK